MLDLVTISEFARQLSEASGRNIHRTTVANLCDIAGIVPKRVPLNGTAKGLDGEDREKIAKTLGFDLSVLSAITVPA